jgi:hypothetical protein
MNRFDCPILFKGQAQLRTKPASRCARMTSKSSAPRTLRMTIHWYLGHMHKTQKDMIERLPQVDPLIEILDARIPSSSENPAIAKLRGDTPC